MAEERIAMTGWHGWQHMTGSGWGATTVVLLLLVLVAGVLAVTARSGQGSPDRDAPAPPRSAEELLDERLARGEITPDEYRQRRAALAGSGRPPTAPV